MRDSIPNAVRAALLVLLLAVPAAAQRNEAPRSAATDNTRAVRMAKAAYDDAAKAYQAKDYKRAEKELALCLERVPTYSEAHLLWAKLHYARKEFAEALSRMELAESTWDESVERLKRQQSERWEEIQRRRRAIDEKIREDKTTLAGNLSREARSLVQGAVDQGYEQLREIDRLLAEPQPLPEAMPAEYPFFHGNILLRLQRRDDAAAKYHEALRIKPDYPEAVNNLAALYLGANLPREALEVIEAAEAVGVTVNPELRQAVLAAIGS